jgi:hypothetical protein
MGIEAAVGILNVVGGVTQAYGQVQAGRSSARVAEFNAQMAELQARDAERRGGEAANRHRQQVTRVIGSQRAALAAQGVDVGDGSALDMQIDTASLGELDALQIRNNAAREAFGYRASAIDSRRRGRLGRADSAGQAFNTILTTGIESYGMYRSWKR